MEIEEERKQAKKEALLEAAEWCTFNADILVSEGKEDVATGLRIAVEELCRRVEELK